MPADQTRLNCQDDNQLDLDNVLHCLMKEMESGTQTSLDESLDYYPEANSLTVSESGSLAKSLEEHFSELCINEEFEAGLNAELRLRILSGHH